MESEAAKRWLVSLGTATDYAEFVTQRVVEKLGSRIEEETKKARDNYVPPPSPVRTALDLFKAMGTPQRQPVERRAFKEMLMAKANLSDENAEKLIRMMFREGMVYESRPGFLRMLDS